MGDHYPLPAVPVCALLAALSLEHLISTWRRPRRLAARTAAVAHASARPTTYYGEGPNSRSQSTAPA